MEQDRNPSGDAESVQVLRNQLGVLIKSSCPHVSLLSVRSNSTRSLTVDLSLTGGSQRMSPH